jgi:hypothetical protein
VRCRDSRSDSASVGLDDGALGLLASGKDGLERSKLRQELSCRHEIEGLESFREAAEDRF